MEFFRYFPRIEYGNDIVTNITVRSKIRESILNNTLLYYPYIVSDFERPDTLSISYYGHSKYTWLIFYANDIFDPIYDWVLTYDNFIKYLNNKYSVIGDSRPGFQIANQTIHAYINERNLIVDWTTWANEVVETMNEVETSHSFSVGEIISLISTGGTEQKVRVTKIDNTVIPARIVSFEPIFDDSLSGILTVPMGGKYIKTKYRYEEELNESKRNIKLLDEVYKNQIMSELKKIYR